MKTSFDLKYRKPEFTWYPGMSLVKRYKIVLNINSFYTMKGSIENERLQHRLQLKWGNNFQLNKLQSVWQLAYFIGYPIGL